MKNAYRTWLSLSDEFFAAYASWHTSGQYAGEERYATIEECKSDPPVRERDDYYQEELDVVTRHFRRFKGARVLEIGTGDGNLTWKVARLAHHVESWDIDPIAITVADIRLRSLGVENVTLRVKDAQTAGEELRETFDVICFVQVLEHLPAALQGPFYDRVLSMTAPGGCIFISTPNRWHPRDSHDTGKYFVHWLPRAIKIPLARAFGWGIEGHDPCWSHPPILHDYVSYRWLVSRARKCWGQVRSSEMSFFPTSAEWRLARRSAGGGASFARGAIAWVGRFLNLNYFFGDKVILQRPATDSLRGSRVGEKGSGLPSE